MCLQAYPRTSGGGWLVSSAGLLAFCWALLASAICDHIQLQEGTIAVTASTQNNISVPNHHPLQPFRITYTPLRLRDVRYSLRLCASSPHGIRQATSATRSHPSRFTPQRVTSARPVLQDPGYRAITTFFHVPRQANTGHHARRPPQEGAGERQNGVEEAKVQAGVTHKLSFGLQAKLPGQLADRE